MSMLTIATEAEAEALADQIQGRMENMADDGQADSPDCQDSGVVLAALNAIEHFPATIPMVRAVAVQAAIALENLRDDPAAVAMATAIAARSTLPDLTS